MAQEASTKETGADKPVFTLSSKEMARIVIAGFSLLAAGAGSLGYLVIGNLVNDDGGRFYEKPAEWEKRFTEHKQRVFNTCESNREAVEYQIESLQIQITDLSEWINKIQRTDDNFDAKFTAHLKAWNTHIEWGRDRIAEEDTADAETQKTLERNKARIEELYRLVNRILTERIHRPGYRGSSMLDPADRTRGQHAANGN